MFVKIQKTLLSKPFLMNSAFKVGKSAPGALCFKKMISVSQYSFSGDFKNQKYASKPVDSAEKFTPEFESRNVGTVILEQSAPKALFPIRNECANLNKFMSKIYRTTGLSITSSLALSCLVAKTGFIASPMLALFGGFATSIGGFIALQKIKPEIRRIQNANGELFEKLVNPLSRKIAFSAIIAGSGLFLSPFMLGLIATNPAIIPMAASLSLFVMGGASIYSTYKPLGHFKAWESTLFGALVGLIGMNLISLGAAGLLGPNLFSLACSRIDMYVGLGLFTAMQAFDTHTAVQAHQNGNYDHLTHVVDFYLNFQNIFIRIASILRDFGDD